MQQTATIYTTLIELPQELSLTSLVKIWLVVLYEVHFKMSHYKLMGKTSHRAKQQTHKNLSAHIYFYFNFEIFKVCKMKSYLIA